ncbi:hypothetical protein [Streptomyces sp. NPDC005533]|uniref:hypothetical protein n=1 Tax=Streptomyces sp. NPDC005533 TaxID=3364723 RepID=UPI0036B5D054
MVVGGGFFGGAVAVTAAGRGLHGRRDFAQAEEGEGPHGDHGQAEEADDAVVRGVGVLDDVRDEGDDDAGGDEDGAAGGEVVEVLQAPAEHADAERQQQRGADHGEHARKAGPLAGEEELVEDGCGEEDERAVGGDAGVAVGVEGVVDDGAADEAGTDEVADVSEVAGGQ